MVTEKMIEAAADALYKDACAGTVAPPPDLKELGSEEIANDFRRQARAALLAAEAAAWEGMETAPTGQDILIRCDGAVGMWEFSDEWDCWINYAWAKTATADDASARWRYIPTPPETSDE